MMKIEVEVIQDKNPTKARYYLVLLRHKGTGRTFCETINWNPLFNEWDIITKIYEVIGWVNDPYELNENQIKAQIKKGNNSIKTKLEAPWYSYQKILQALFEGDSDISIGTIMEDPSGETNYVLNIEVMNHKKFAALDRVLPSTITFGNVTVRNIIYDLENKSYEDYGLSLYQTLFEGNDLVADFKAVIDNLGTKHIYLRFKPEVVQFYDDDLTDYSGNWSGLAQDIAREIFAGNTYGVNFCTADKDEEN